MYRKNVASQNLPFALINAATGAAMTGATVSGFRSIDGGAQAGVTGTLSEKANGQYNLALSQADTNGNHIGYLFTATGAIPAHITVALTAADPTDATAFGISRLDAAITTRASQTSLDTVDDFIDTEVAAIKAKTDQLTFTTANKIDATLNIAADFPQAAADKVWSSTTRTLSAFAFAVDLSTTALAAIWDRATSALTTAGSIGKLLVDNINATISSRASQSSLDTLEAAVGDIPTANQNADALLDRANGVETGWTFREAFRVGLASLAGKLSGAATSTVVIRNVTDTKNRITATVDGDGNRSAVTYDKT